MLHRTLVKWIFVTLFCFFVYGCASTHNTKAPLSEEEKAEVYLQLGVRYLSMDMIKAAKENLHIAEQLDSNNEEIYNILGVLYERLQKTGIAREYYQKALDINPDNASIRNNYGRFLCESGEYQTGMQLLKQALAMPLNAKKWLVYTNIGLCELKLGKQSLAEDNFRQALLINNSFSPALSEMQKISYHAGKYMSARAFLERYLAVDKHTAETLWIAVQTERALGNKELTEAYRERLFNQFPASKEAQQLKTAIR